MTGESRSTRPKAAAGYNFPARLLWAVCAASLSSSVGCATAAHRSRLLDQTTDVKADERAMRSALYDYTYRFSRTVELASKRIAADGGDPEIAHRALFWRLGVTSEVQRAAFRTDVLVAMLDVWSLVLQQREFFTTGAGRNSFGSAQPIAVNSSADVLEDMLDTAKWFAGDQAMQKGAKEAGEWAAQHPIRDLSFSRRSIASRYVDRLVATDIEHTPTQSLANMESSIEDLLQRMNVYTDQIPRQAMAQSEQLLDSFLDKPRVTRTFSMLDGMRDDMASMTSVVAGMPEMIRRERVAALESAFASIATERGMMLDAITRERVAMQETLHQERALVMGDAKQMLQDTLRTLVAERQTAMRELPATTVQALALNESRLEGMIDRVIVRMLWGLALLLGVAGSVLMLLVLLARRSGFFAPRESVLPEAPKVVAKT